MPTAVDEPALASLTLRACPPVPLEPCPVRANECAAKRAIEKGIPDDDDDDDVMYVGDPAGEDAPADGFKCVHGARLGGGIDAAPVAKWICTARVNAGASCTTKTWSNGFCVRTERMPRCDCVPDDEDDGAACPNCAVSTGSCVSNKCETQSLIHPYQRCT